MIWKLDDDLDKMGLSSNNAALDLVSVVESRHWARGCTTDRKLQRFSLLMFDDKDNRASGAEVRSGFRDLDRRSRSDGLKIPDQNNLLIQRPSFSVRGDIYKHIN